MYGCAITLQHLLTHTSGLQRGAGRSASGAEAAEEGGGGIEERPSLPFSPQPPAAPSPGISHRRVPISRRSTESIPGASGLVGEDAAFLQQVSSGLSTGAAESAVAAVDRPSGGSGPTGAAAGELPAPPPPPSAPLPPPAAPPPPPPRVELPATNGVGRSSDEGSCGPLDSAVSLYLLERGVHGGKAPGVFRPDDIDYWLVGAVVEALAGVPYDTHVRETLLTPLGVQLPACAPRGPRGPNGSETGGGEAGPRVTVWPEPLPPAAKQPRVQPRRYSSGDGSGRGGAPSGEEQSLGPPPVPEITPAVRYTPPPLTPVGGLVLPPRDAARLLGLLVRNPNAGGGGGGEGGEGSSRTILAALCEVRLSDFVKDVGVAMAGLLATGLGRCGDSVVAAESPPPPPSVRELALGSQAAAAAQAHFQSLAQGAQAHRSSTASGAGGGRDSGTGGAEGPPGPSLGPPASASPCCVLVLAPESGLALLVAANTAPPAGAAFCKKVACHLLERFRPAEMPGPLARSWLAAVPPARQDAVVQLVAFPPACCPSPVALFEGWAVQLPDYLRLRCLQAPGHGSRRGEAPALRLAKLVAPAASAIASGCPPDAPLALFGHGLGALWAFETARRLEGWLGRSPMHLFVSACAAPTEFATAGSSSGGTHSGGRRKPFSPWAGSAGSEGGASTSGGGSGGASGPDPTPLHEQADEPFVTALAAHRRCPKALRSHPPTLVDHLPLLRADVELESHYTYTPPPPTLAASVASVLAAVQGRAEEESRLCASCLSCPITVFTPEDEAAAGLGPELTAGWEQVTTGQVRFTSVPGDFMAVLESRQHSAPLLTAMSQALSKQLSVHGSWTAKLRPAESKPGGRARLGGVGSRPQSGARPDAGVGLLPPVYPRT
ncbi:hypothetical protein HYH03_002939 [Edaphochlamys debaryana]|uniref:Thioesterase domain-containing protein n=1 Tax=Edaphochlamys debaryana TaxID=47281 RepID=A0A835YCU5_9CHLO|nr:hypothetical protein HYH03_002939 [Edaphochlamys debaryana]|eukprot:KAG2499364.1 hypothetical protein HYH03_002939 [Edaphochlamys debaryana]